MSHGRGHAAEAPDSPGLGELLGHVHHGAEDPDRPLLWIANNVAAIENVGPSSVDAPESVFTRPRKLTGLDGLVIRMHDALPVIGVNVIAACS